jgi:hypothetical protein
MRGTMLCSPQLLARFSFVLVAATVCALVLAPGALARGLHVASPREGSTLSRTATFTPKLTGELKQRTRRVEVWVGSKMVARDLKAPFKAKVNTRLLQDGLHTFRVRAFVRDGQRLATSRVRTISRKVRAVVSNRTKKPAPPAELPPVAKQPAAPEAPVDPRIGSITGGDADYETIFADEFDGNSLDTAKWNNQRDDWLKGGVPFNNLEGAWYEPANTSVTGGVLKQTITRRSSTLTNPHGTFDYSTGMVNSNKRFGFTYGYVESRMRVPSCSGCWPAFWMLPVKEGWPPEIDIFEFFDSAQSKVPYFSSHWKSETTTHEGTTNIYGDPAGDYTDDWHTYGMLWTEDSVQSFVDGRPGPIYTGKAVPHEAMYLIIQAAIGIGYPTPDGANLQTDYVRVYQQR